MDYAAIAFVVLTGASLILAVVSWRYQKDLEQRLNALRSNCFVTSERGHRIRYVNASPEVRARAETN